MNEKLWNSPEISTQGGERANPQASSSLTCSFYLLIQTACACYFTQQEWNEKYELICIHLLPLARGEKTSNACLAQREILDHCYFEG